MSACCCSLAGTAACQTCPQNPFAVMSNMMTPQQTALRDIMVNPQIEKPTTNADRPYEKIGSVVEQWCKDHVYAQMLVTISIGYDWEPPHEETHLLDFDAEKGELVWDSDWWEGQQHVELVGFTPLYKVRLKGEGEYARTVRHGYDLLGNSLFECSLCHWRCDDTIPGGEYNYCPGCGAKLDGGKT